MTEHDITVILGAFILHKRDKLGSFGVARELNQGNERFK
jgi:hypothetical protein